MILTKNSGKLIGAGALSAVAASLCCITPVIALLAGSSSIAANFSWIEPAQPYLIGLSVAVLAFAWYQKLKSVDKNDMNCNCDTVEKPSFWQSKTFLGIVTVFAVLMITFPLYAGTFFPKPLQQTVPVAQINNIQTATFLLKGMSCEACEGHVNGETAKIKGVVDVKTSYVKGTSTVKFNNKQATVEQIKTGIAKTGYKVVSFNLSK